MVEWLNDVECHSPKWSMVEMVNDSSTKVKPLSMLLGIEARRISVENHPFLPATWCALAMVDYLGETGSNLEENGGSMNFDEISQKG